MKDKDKIIISHLRNDARMPLTKLSKKTRIPVSTLFDRIKNQQKENLVTKYTSLLNFAALGYLTRANIVLKVSKEDRDKVKSYLLAHDNVNSFYRINNGYDFMVEAIFKQIAELENFIENIEGQFDIQDKNAFYIIEDIKKEDFMANSDLIKVMKS